MSQVRPPLFSPLFGSLFGCAALLAAGFLPAQTPASPPVAPQQTPATTDNPEPTLPKGQILIQSHGDAPSPSQATPGGSPPESRVPDENAKVDVSDAERSALSFPSYDLDARLNLARSAISVRARVTVRNTGSAALRQLPLQISSTLHWESATLAGAGSRSRLALAQHRLDTDADHTGAATEAVLALPEPLAPGASVDLDLFYSGTIAQDAGRLGRLGANAAQGQDADWDAIGSSWTGLRGFGDVLWYPVASPQLFLAEGNSLFTALGRAKLHDTATQMRLRLSVEYVGEPPAGAYFCGRRAALEVHPDDPDAPLATGAGVASAEFSPAPLGFRLPSLFVLGQPETLLGGGSVGAPDGAGSAGAFSSSAQRADAPANPKTVSPSGQSGGSGPVIALVSSDAGVAQGLAAAADNVEPLLAEWLGPRPLSALTILDHNGQPFQDGPLLVAPAATLETSTEAPAMVYSLTHAWVQTGQPWMDDGLAQYLALLWIEREGGREAALSQLSGLMQPVAAVEPDLASNPQSSAGQPLVAASDEFFYRRKAAAVWWMLRDLAGEQPLRAALSAWRTQPETTDAPAVQAVAFEHLLERLSHKDLGWFFQDWVLRDRGLPDLTIADVQTSQTPAGPGHSTGWLVAVTVRNDGGAVADVPVVVRSGQFSSTQRIRVPGLSQATQRVLVEAAPTAVTVNDGGTPEVRVSIHTRELNLREK